MAQNLSSEFCDVMLKWNRLSRPLVTGWVSMALEFVNFWSRVLGEKFHSRFHLMLFLIWFVKFCACWSCKNISGNTMVWYFPKRPTGVLMEDLIVSQNTILKTTAFSLWTTNQDKEEETFFPGPLQSFPPSVPPKPLLPPLRGAAKLGSSAVIIASEPLSNTGFNCCKKPRPNTLIIEGNNGAFHRQNTVTFNLKWAQWNKTIHVLALKARMGIRSLFPRVLLANEKRSRYIWSKRMVGWKKLFPLWFYLWRCWGNLGKQFWDNCKRADFLALGAF